MTNQELLKLAAKGAGIELEPTTEGYPLYIPMWGIWNPLENDGDALRLAVKLEMALDLTIAMQEGADVQAEDIDVECNGDPYAATRRAIVLAAAEIGKQVTP